MRCFATVLIAGATLFLSVFASAQFEGRAAESVLPMATAVAPIPSADFLKALTLQTDDFAAAAEVGTLHEALLNTLAHEPVAETPEAFAARVVTVAALKAPKTELPTLISIVRSAGTAKAKKLAGTLEELHRVIMARDLERGDMMASAAKLSESYDGASAAPGEEVDLSAYPTKEPGPRKSKVEELRLREIKKLNLLQKEMYAGGQKFVLVVLDGIDTAGKGGVIKAFRGINLAWTRTEQIKKPTDAEFAEHFLDRFWRKAPHDGESKIIFLDRSYYEDILVPTVMRALHKKDPVKNKEDAKFSDEEIESRYAHVLEFERAMAARGGKIIKIFLNVSNKVQYKRLKKRMEDPLLRWKSPPMAKKKDETKAESDDLEIKISDHETRKNFATWIWGRRPILARTSVWWALWHVIGADNKKTRDLAAVRLVRREMERMNLRFPEYPELDGVKVPK